MSQSRYAGLSRSELAVLLPELLLIGQLIDRSGMAWCIQAFGRQEMLQIAIEEWAGASPIYTKRMQKALNFEGDDVPTIFKGLQLDIGAPPQFMDFRFTLHDRWHGEFHLDHCGALLNPAGYVLAETSPDRLVVHNSPAHADGAWISLCTPASVQPLQAIATAVDPHLKVRISGTDTDWTAELIEADAPASELPEVLVAKVSRGSVFQFEPRRSLPLTVK